MPIQHDAVEKLRWLSTFRKKARFRLMFSTPQWNLDDAVS